MSMMRVAVWGLVVGCPRPAGPMFDPNLPEQQEEISDTDPRSILEAGAGLLDPTARALALSLLIADGAGPEWDARGLGDPSPWVQRSVVEALVRRGDPQGVAQLNQFTAQPDRDPFVRLLAAVRVPGPEVAAAVSAAWRLEAEAWRRAPLALAALRNGDSDARAALSDALATGDLALETGLFLEIGRSGDTTLLPALEIAQGRAEEELELAVAAARLHLGDPTAEQPFRKTISGADVERRLEALDYLVLVEEPAAIRLVERAMGEGPEIVSLYAALSLAARDGSDPDVFGRAARDADREIRALAMRFSREAAAGGTASKRVVKAARQVVISGLSDTDPVVRAEALRGVRDLDLAEARAGVSPLLSDDNGLVRLEAAGTLLALTHE